MRQVSNNTSKHVVVKSDMQMCHLTLLPSYLVYQLFLLISFAASLHHHPPPGMSSPLPSLSPAARRSSAVLQTLRTCPWFAGDLARATWADGPAHSEADQLNRSEKE